MKPTPITAFLLSFFLTFTATAQEPAEKKPAAPASESESRVADPFIKKKEGEKAKEEASAPEKFVNVGTLFQYIDVKRERWQKWLAENATPLDAGALRREVDGWLTTGDAELAETSLVMGKPGQRSKVESIREQFYPTEFGVIAGGQPIPTAFEVRNLGTTSEVDPIFNPDSSVDINMAPERVRYLGELPPVKEMGALEGDIRWPQIAAQKVNCMATLGTNQWAILGSEASLERPDTHQTLIFLRPLVHEFEVKAEKGKSGGQGMITLQWLEVGEEALNRWILGAESMSSLIGGGLQATAIAGGAKKLEERVIRFKSGQRAKNESTSETIYATGYDPGSEPDDLATPVAFETRNTGITIEVDPVFNPEETVLDLSMAPEQVSLLGTSVHHRILSKGEWIPNLAKPVFYTLKTTTQLALPLDTQILVSVMSPSDDEGFLDASRKVLLFVKVSR